MDIDNRHGAKKITEHLLDEGYRRIAFIGGQKNESLFLRRFAGYSDKLRLEGLGVNPVWCFPEGNGEENGYEIVNKMLNLPILPDAIICMNNYVAFGALRRLQEEGISVPKDIGIVTFDNEPLAPYTTPPLTSLHMDTFGLGVKSAEVLMDVIQDYGLTNREETEEAALQTWIEPQLVVRGSSARSK
ncbi:HTH-type transcriptional repressor CytR [compost metagenome]